MPRLNRGWSEEQALTEPVRHTNRVTPERTLMADTTLAVPKSKTGLDRLAETFAASRLFPDAKSALQAAAKLQMGRSLGISDYSSMTGLLVSQSGKITMTANLMAQLIKTYSPPYLKGEPKYRTVMQEHTDKSCVIEVRENVPQYTDSGKKVFRWEKIGVGSFTEADAVKAQLTTGPNKASYARYPRNMLFARNVSNVAKWYCADAFAGESPYLPDELGDTNVKVDYETLEIVSIDGEAVNEASGNRQVLTALVAETGADLDKLLGYYKADSLASLADADVEHAIDTLQKRLAAK